jgi:hypothetical protein
VSSPSKPLAQTLYVFERVPSFLSYKWPAGFYVIRTEKDWSDFLAKPLIGYEAPPRLSSVDFSQRMIIIVNLGIARPGYELRITKYDLSANKIYYSVVTPRSGVPYFGMDSRLIDIVVVPKSDSPVVFYFEPFS